VVAREGAAYGAGALSEQEQADLAAATALALEWHGAQERKGSRVPYVSHLLQVAGLVLEHGGDAEQAAAALLHDALEDAPSPGHRTDRERRILDALGPGAVQIVVDCTDTQEHEHAGAKAPWRERKTRFLERLPLTPPRSLLVVACDKRHNLAAMVADLHDHGPDYLAHFNADTEAQVWYFENVLKALEGRVPNRLVREMALLLDELRALGAT